MPGFGSSDQAKDLIQPGFVILSNIAVAVMLVTVLLECIDISKMKYDYSHHPVTMKNDKYLLHPKNKNSYINYVVIHIS